MANFTLSASLTSGAKPDAYLVDDTYNQEIKFSVGNFTGDDLDSIQKIVLYHAGNVLGTVDAGNNACLNTSGDLTIATVNSNILGIEKDTNSISAVAYDTYGNIVGSANTTVETITLPEWIYDPSTEIKSFTDNNDGTFSLELTETWLSEKAFWLNSITVVGQTFDLSELNPSATIYSDYKIYYDGHKLDMKKQGDSFSVLGLFFSPSHDFTISEKKWEFAGEDGEVAAVKVDVEFNRDWADSDLSATIKVEGEYGVSFDMLEALRISKVIPVQTPIPGIQLDPSIEIKDVISVSGEFQFGGGSLGGGITIDPSISVEIKGGVSAGVSDLVKLIEIGVFGEGKVDCAFALGVGSFDSGVNVNATLKAGFFIDALSVKCGCFSYKAFGYKYNAIDETWTIVGTSKFSTAQAGNNSGSSKNALEITSNYFSDCNAVWDSSGNEITFSANLEAPASSGSMNYYDVVLRYATYDAQTQKYGEVESVKVAQIHDNACFKVEKTLALDPQKTYAYVFAILPQEEVATDNSVSVGQKAKLLSSSAIGYTLPTISVENITVKEPAADNMSTLKEATFTAKLSTASNKEITFYWFTEDGTAIDQEDYLGVQDGVVTFAPGETEKTFTVQVIGDGQKEDEEAFFVNLTAGNNAYFSLSNAIGDDNTRGYAECVIQDNDYKGAAVVTVIDHSGSMYGSRMSSAKNAAYTTINNMRTGDYIGVVGFASYASTCFSLTQITDDSVKSAAKNAVSGMYASGGTFIGGGIQQASSMLSGVDATTKSIIVMTDGEDGSSYQTKNIISNLPKGQYLIYGIGYGTQSSAAVDALSVAVDSDVQLSTSYSSKTYMEELMDLCDGKYYYAADADDLEEIYFDLSTRSSNQQLITKKSDSVEMDNITVESVVVDSSCTTVRFGINWTSGDLDLELWDPNGKHYDSSTTSENIRFVSNGTSEYYEITAPTCGVWGFAVNGKTVSGDEENFDYYAIATSTIDTDLNFDDTRAAVNQQIAMTCTVTNDDSSVLNASVYARVQDTAGNTSYVDLYDDGLHSDGMANDGVYGNVITETTAGVYKVTAYAEGTSTMGDTFYRQTVEEQFQVDVNAKASAISIHGDFNGDGLADIVQYDYAKSKNVTAWYAQEDGSMKWGYVNNAASDWTISSMTGDFTGNGSDDIMWINESSGHIGTWQTDGDSTKWSILTITDFDEWSLQGIGDFNGDGTDDMLFRNRLNNLVGTLDVENGEQKVGSWKVINGTTDAWQIAGTGDFNGDKVDDILLTNTVSGQVGIWNMSRSGYSSWTSLSFTDFAEWRIKGIADFNGDGTDDILFENEKTGVVGSWNISNGAIKEWSLIGIADVSSDWKISGVGDFNGDQVAEIAWTNLNSDRIGCWTQDKENLAQWSILA